MLVLAIAAVLLEKCKPFWGEPDRASCISLFNMHAHNNRTA
jgi:hypothetical protein